MDSADRASDRDRPACEPPDAAGSDRAVALPAHKRALLAALRAERAQAAGDDRRLVRLRPGDGPAVVLVHPVGGELLCYAELVRLLPAGLAVLGLSAGRTERSAPAALPQLAADYLGRLREAGVEPGVFAGWSAGGVIAYEMSCQHADSAEPRPAVLIDSVPAPREYGGAVRDQPTMLEQFVRDLVRSAGEPDDAVPADSAQWRGPARDVLARATDELRRAGIDLGLSTDELAGRFAVYRPVSLAIDRYQPSTSTHPLTLVRGAESEVTPRPWHGVANLANDHVVPGDHYELLRHPAVREVADVLRATVPSATGS